MVLYSKHSSDVTKNQKSKAALWFLEPEEQPHLQGAPPHAKEPTTGAVGDAIHQTALPSCHPDSCSHQYPNSLNLARSQLSGESGSMLPLIQGLVGEE